jgi:excisionase family DNA binding protein
VTCQQPTPVWSPKRLTDSPTATAPEPSPALTDPEYTVHDLAQRLQCSDRHIWRMLDRKLIPGVIRIGRLVRLHRPTVDAWIANGCKPCRTAGRE